MTGDYDTKLIASDWRYSAMIVGLKKYFDFFDIEFKANKDKDYIEYNAKDITDSRYLQFVEHHYREYMHHKVIEDIFENEEISEEQSKLINKKLKGNAMMEKTFAKLTYEDKKEILMRIDENREAIIRETYRNGIHMYRKFANENSLFAEKEKTCRLKGYYVDPGRKTKSVSYMNDYNTFIFEDEPEFDFIPFAFTKSSESIFINNNYNLRTLYETARKLEDVFTEHREEVGKSTRELLFNYKQNAATFIDYDVEVITKDIDVDYYKTLYIRKPAIEIFKAINNYKCMMFTKKIGKDYYIDIQKEVTNSILNLSHIDKIIEMLLKEKTGRAGGLIHINSLIYGGDKMDQKMKSAYGTALKLKEKFKKESKLNKIDSYRQRLISAITLKDYDKFCDVLIQMSAYSQIPFSFSFDLFENFEENKNVAYTFINALGIEPRKEGKESEEV